MTSRKKPGQKAIDQFRQRIEEKVARVREGRDNVDSCRRVVAGLTTSVVTHHGPRIVEQGMRLIDSTFAELDLYLAQLRQDSVQVVNNIVSSIQGRLVGMLERLEILEQSMREAEQEALQLFELDTKKFQAKYPATSRQLEECLDSSVNVLAECPSSADILSGSSGFWELDLVSLKTTLRQKVLPQFVVPDAWGEVLPSDHDEDDDDGEDAEEQGSVVGHRLNGTEQASAHALQRAHANGQSARPAPTAKKVPGQAALAPAIATTACAAAAPVAAATAAVVTGTPPPAAQAQDERVNRFPESQLRQVAYIINSNNVRDRQANSSKSRQSVDQTHHSPTSESRPHQQCRQQPKQEQHGQERSPVPSVGVHQITPPARTVASRSAVSVSEVSSAVSTSTSSALSEPQQRYHPACLLLGETHVFTGLVIELSSPNDFWVQITSSQLDDFMAQMSDHFEKNGPRQLGNAIIPGQVCAAQFSQDNSWYRAIVTEVRPNGQCAVLYVDYGNTELAAVASLALLDEKFQRIPFHAVHCQLSEVRPLSSSSSIWSQEASQLFATTVAGITVTGTILSRRDTPLIPTHCVQLRTPPDDAAPSGLSVGNVLVESGLALLSRAAEQKLAEDIASLSSDQEQSSSSAPSMHHHVAHSPDIASTHNNLQQSAHTRETAATSHTVLSESPTSRNVTAGSVSQHAAAAADSRAMTTHTRDPSTGDSRHAQPVASASACQPTGSQSQASPAQTRRRSRGGRAGERKRNAPSSSDCSSQEVCNRSPSRENLTQKSRTGLSPLSRIDLSRAAVRNSTIDVEKRSQNRLNSIEYDSANSGECADSEGSSNVDSASGSNLPSYQPPCLPVENGSLKVMMSRAVGPSEFYLHVVSKEPVVQLNMVTELLSKLHGDSEVDMFTPQIFEPCCVFCTEDDTWYRGVCMGIEMTSAVADGGDVTQSVVEQLRVQLVDYGEVLTVGAGHVRRLPDELLRIPILAVRCSLAILSDENTADYGVSGTQDMSVWCDKATQHLEDYVSNGRILIAHLISAHRNTPSSTLQDKTSVAYYYPKSSTRPWLHSIDVNLFDTNANDFHFNTKLRRDQFELDQLLDDGKPDVGFSSAALADPVVQKALVSWDPMGEDFTSMSNSYGVDLSNAGQAVAGYGGKQGRAICRNFMSGRGCVRGKSCRFSHDAKGLVTSDKEFVFCHNYNLALPPVGQWVAVVVSVVVEADRFWIQLPYGNKLIGPGGIESTEDDTEDCGMAEDEDLASMVDRMNKHYKNMKYSGDLVLRACGELVAVQNTEDKRWYRAKVVEAAEESIEVFFVDYGNLAVVSPRDIRALHQEFTHLPFQAVECFLANIMPVSPPTSAVASDISDAQVDVAAKRWHPDARAEMQRMTDGRVLIAKVLSRQSTLRMEVELFNVDGDRFIHLGNELVAAGFAEAVALPCFPPVPSSEPAPCSPDSAKMPTILVPG
ncbi:uncharacterized protein LOC135809180 [Sycon ciliatum]|uniref:uncharacterized protein LOC135809180 n=1 Tax=Sycon ciliatum TaxID=27933 RepID=UPI0031F65C51